MDALTRSKGTALLAGAAVLALVGAACGGTGSGTTGGGEVEVGDEGGVTIVMDEYSFVPANLTLQAGEEVEITLVNEGAKPHELMVGLPFGGGPEWEDDVFARMHPEVLHGEGYEMEGFEDMMHEEEGEEGEEGMHEEEEGMHGPAHGAEFELEPGSQITVRFDVPADAQGEWEMGCFLPQHYESGMKGTLTIE